MCFLGVEFKARHINWVSMRHVGTFFTYIKLDNFICLN